MFSILAINLPERKDRLYHVIEEILKIPHNSFEIMSAIRDTTCFRSHRAAIQKAKDLGLPNVLVLEDDLLWVSREDLVPIITAAVMQLAGREWGILYFGANLQGPAQIVSDNLIRLTAAYALHCYLVNSSAYDAILALESGREMDVAINQEIIPNIPCYCINPMVAYQKPGISNLQGNQFRDYSSELNYNYIRWVYE